MRTVFHVSKSVEPYDAFKYRTSRPKRSGSQILNDYMKANLSSAYTYIDMYSYLKSTGYSFASDHYGAGTIDDGLHYTAKHTSEFMPSV